MIDVLHLYMVLTTDTPWLDHTGDTWGVPCEFKVGLMYCITTGSSPQTSHGSSVCKGVACDVPRELKFLYIYIHIHIYTYIYNIYTHIYINI